MRLEFLIAVLMLPLTALAAPFVNLDFEQATVPTGTPPSERFSAAAAFPGWTARIGSNVQNQVFYNDIGIGGPAAVLYDQSLGIGELPVLQGRYSIVLITDFPDGAEASLSQTGDIPSDARSLRFLGPNRPPVAVQINGTALPLVQIPNPLSSLPAWGADVTTFAGTSAELRLSSGHPPTGGINGGDAFTFSSTPIPEPSAAMMVTLIIGLPMLTRQRRRRVFFARPLAVWPNTRKAPHAVCGIEPLESRCLLSVVAPTWSTNPSNPPARLIYRDAPDLDTNRVYLNYVDTNTTETGYRVEYSPDQTDDWQVLPGPNNGDWPAGAGSGSALQATQIVPVGEKNDYRVSAIDGGDISLPSPIVSAETSIDRAVQLTATVSTTGNGSPMVDITWQPISPYSPANDQPTSYTLYSRALGDTEVDWSNLGDINPGETDYVNFPDPGEGREYELRRHNTGGLDDYGYISVRYGASLPASRGTVLLVVDQTQIDPSSVGADNALAMSSKLDRLDSDLVGDGWSVQRIDVPRDDDLTTARNNVAYVKQQILNVHTAHPNLKSIFIIGHVPVPYSGIGTAFDGHGDHDGAWPADAYYGDFDGDWGGDTASTAGFGLTFPENENLPGDGKFDASRVPSEDYSWEDRVEAAVGRVDFSRLDWHENDGTTPVSESFLLQRYLDKDHAFRTGSLDFVPLDGNGSPLPNKAIVDDEFGPTVGIQDAWSNLAALVGPENVKSAPWNTTLRSTDPSERYLWAFGAGPGEVINDPNNWPGNKYYSYIGKIAQSYSYAGGTVNATPLAGDANFQAVFNVMFGSWVGDWGYPRSLLRSAVASNGIALASMWGERPTWFLQSMSAGATLGDVFLKTINNSSDAANGYVGGSTSPSSYDHSIAIALMGDPTLREGFPLGPQSGFVVIADQENVVFTWDSQAEDSLGYDIYRSTSADGPFTFSGHTTNTSFGDSTMGWDPAVPKYYYMVRGAKLQATPTGSYYNQSTGLFIPVDNPYYVPPKGQMAGYSWSGWAWMPPADNNQMDDVLAVDPAIDQLTDLSWDADGTISRAGTPYENDGLALASLPASTSDARDLSVEFSSGAEHEVSLLLHDARDLGQTVHVQLFDDAGNMIDQRDMVMDHANRTLTWRVAGNVHIRVSGASGVQAGVAVKAA